ncbi:hypothetical protein DMUE_2555 [Dictyocoela muelleri]|nr:hypothetical protein DMUE_2555 [Dictyocoela muelleri]
MAKLNISCTLKIKEHIVEVEKTIINLSRENDTNHNDNPNIEKFPNKKTTVYCKYHKTNLHSTEECRVLANKNNYKNSKKGLLIREPDPAINLIQITGEIESKNALFTIDTGASTNYINEKFIKRNNFTVFKKNPSKVIYGNNETGFISEFTDLTINSIGNEKLKLKSKFSIIKNLPEDIILGNTFLKENKVIIDFNNNLILINNKKIFIEHELITDWKKSPDYQLLCKTDTNSSDVSISNSFS